MALEIIGPGFGRTSTNSLRIALNQLGLGPTHHMHEIANNIAELMPAWQALARGQPPDWDKMFANYRAQVDWPGARYWRELIAHYPNAKVVLSTRDPDKWFDSLSKTIGPLIAARGKHEDPVAEQIAQLGQVIINEELFDGRIDDRAHATKVFRDHLAEVKAEVPPSKLLVWQARDGWEPLCDFLGVPVPDTPFPNTNTTEDFNDRSKTVR